MPLTVILIIISFPSPTHSFIPGLKFSFSANPSHHSLSFSSSGLTTWIPPDFCCYFWPYPFYFLVSVLHFLVVVSDFPWLNWLMSVFVLYLIVRSGSRHLAIATLGSENDWWRRLSSCLIDKARCWQVRYLDLFYVYGLVSCGSVWNGKYHIPCRYFPSCSQGHWIVPYVLFVFSFKYFENGSFRNLYAYKPAFLTVKSGVHGVWPYFSSQAVLWMLVCTNQSPVLINIC